MSVPVDEVSAVEDLLMGVGRLFLLQLFQRSDGVDFAIRRLLHFLEDGVDLELGPYKLAIFHFICDIPPKPAFQN